MQMAGARRQVACGRPPTARTRKFSARYGMNTTPRANGPGSGGSTISLAAGSLSMNDRALGESTCGEHDASRDCGKRLDAQVHCILSPGGFARVSGRGMTRTTSAPSRSTSRPQRLERCAYLIREVLRLFPGREMAALGQAAVMQKLRERAFGPTLRRGVDFSWGTRSRRREW